MVPSPVDDTSSVPKDKLESSYSELSKSVILLVIEVKKSVNDANAQLDKSLELKLNEFQILLSKSEERFEALDTQLTGLLPGEMAAGLSAAYEEKK